VEEKLKELILKYEDNLSKLSDPEIVSNQKLLTDLNREQKNLSKIVEVAKKYLKLISDYENNKIIMRDKTMELDFRELAEEENKELDDEIPQLEEEIKFLLIPKDPNDHKDCIFELRAGTGGDEAGIFCGDLFRMYSRWADINGYKIDIISLNESERGGFKEIVFSLSGEEIYGKAKFESGVHRVQRVPDTETNGRVHTSAATVAVLPEAEEVDVEIRDEDLRIDIFRSGGKGGQNVNKVETAVRLVHIPSGIVVSCQEERSQLKNRQKAMKVLRTRLYEMELEKQVGDISSQRRSMVKSGDRSEKIRTYNFPQNRLTDHRLEGEMKNYPLREVIEGDLDPVIQNLQIAERTELLKLGNV
jgi:peptide chain release factor 1